MKNKQRMPSSSPTQEPAPFVIRHLLLFSLAVLVAGCSSFNREWKQATRAPVPTNNISGPWQGTWQSNSNGHRGGLRCVITRISPDEYQAHFRASYRKILRFGYVVALRGTNEHGETRFQGEADLGKMAGGLYRYVGEASPARFYSTYSAARDAGTFQMIRPKGITRSKHDLIDSASATSAR